MVMLRFVISATALAAARAEHDGSTEASCMDSDRCVGGDSSALLQVARSTCAMNGQDPYHNHNGECCTNTYQPLYKIKGKWSSDSCSFLCKTCSTEGEDVYRYCGSHCGGCHAGGDELVPCCPGYYVSLEDGKHICRRYDSQNDAAVADAGCAEADEDPHYQHNGQCCEHPSEPLYKIIGKWSGDYCSYQCKQCSQEGEDTFRFCGSHCGGCERGGEEYAPCCPGLDEVQEGSSFVCRQSGGSDDARKCSFHPQCAGLAGDCCPNSAGQFLACCQSQCSAYPKCAGLAGNCCPNDSGVTLACCN